MKLQLHSVSEYVTKILKKAKESLHNILFQPVLQDYSEIVDTQNEHSVRFLLITILLLCSVDLISQILVYQFHEFGYCIYMIMVVGFLSAIYFAFLADPSPKSDRQTDADNPANKSQRKLDGKSTDRNSTITLYIYECVILLTAGFLHLTLFPEERGTMFLLLLVLLPMLIFDQFWRVCLMILSISVIYILFSVSVLSLDKAGSDIVYTNIAAVVSLIWTGGVIRHRTNTLHSNEISETSAAHDGLTGIYNRKGGDAVINNCILNGIPGAFIILDVDYFKHVNDTYGHQIGDRVLKEVADCLTRSFRKEDIVTRLGGDEFVVYAVRMADRTYVTKKLTEVLENMRKIPICEADHDYVTVSIGCAINDGTYLDYNALYTLADHMLYITKNSGKNSFHITDRSFSGQPVQHTHS